MLPRNQTLGWRLEGRMFTRVLLGSDLWKGGKEVGEVELQHGPSEDSAAPLQGALEPGLS